MSATSLLDGVGAISLGANTCTSLTLGPAGLGQIVITAAGITGIPANKIYGTGVDGPLAIVLTAGAAALNGGASVITAAWTKPAKIFTSTAPITNTAVSATTMQLVRDIYCSGLTIDTGLILSTNGFRVFCNGILTFGASSQIIASSLVTTTMAGGLGTGAAAGAAGAAIPAAPISSGLAGALGGAPTAAGALSTGTTNTVGGFGGLGGAGAAAAGGIGATVIPTVAVGGLEILFDTNNFTKVSTTTNSLLNGGGSGSGGGGGSTNGGGGGLGVGRGWRLPHWGGWGWGHWWWDHLGRC